MTQKRMMILPETKSVLQMGAAGKRMLRKPLAQRL